MNLSCWYHGMSQPAETFLRKSKGKKEQQQNMGDGQVEQGDLVDFNAPLTSIRGVNTTTGRLLCRAGLVTVGDCCRLITQARVVGRPLDEFIREILNLSRDQLVREDYAAYDKLIEDNPGLDFLRENRARERIKIIRRWRSASGFAKKAIRQIDQGRWLVHGIGHGLVCSNGFAPYTTIVPDRLGYAYVNISSEPASAVCLEPVINPGRLNNDHWRLPQYGYHNVVHDDATTFRVRQDINQMPRIRQDEPKELVFVRRIDTFDI